ncbi:MAG: extracellular solute-binding protein [Candidatus Riflebacteria bacterium]|nr:extracellular solute-binding protein [Candidatus Riflebacteria bacterium]
MKRSKLRFTKEIVLIFVLILSGIIFQAGCGKKETKTADGRTILTFWHTYRDSEEDFLKEIIKEWEKDNKEWSIQAVRIPFDGHKPKLRTSLTVEKGPDMARVDWSFVCELARKNAVVNIDEFGFEKIKDNYLPAPLGTNYIDGHYYGFPDQSNCVALFYNKKLFREAGLDAESPPKTWEDFVSYGKKITNSEKGVFAFAMDNTVWWTLPFFNSFGAKIISPDGNTCLLDSKEAIDALEFKASLFTKHKIEAGAWRSGSITPDQGFINGKYAMIFSGPWILPQFKATGIEFGVGLIPAGPSGTSSNVGGTNVVILKSSKYHKPCYDFLTFFTNPQSQAKWCKALDQIPINIKAYEHVQFEDKHLMTFMEQMKSAVSNPIVTNFETLEDIVNPEMEAVITGQKTAKEALTNAARKVERKVLKPLF